MAEKQARHRKKGSAPEAADSGLLRILPSRPQAEPSLDLRLLRERLEGARGKDYWRCLEEVADSPEFRLYLEREFPRQAPRDMEPLSRRGFLKLMGASLALAGLAGCAYQPAEKIVPYVKQPEDLVPGVPLYFATAFTRQGYALGLLAESHEGRPTKLEGNPSHPASLGATDAIAQASLLTLYDPERSQTVRSLGDASTWDVFLGTLTGEMQAKRSRGGAGFRFLTETITSPTLAAQIQALLAEMPQARWHQWEPVSRDNVRAGARLAFGVDANPVWHFGAARTILSLDCSFLDEEPGSVRYARDFADGRRVRADHKVMNRLYCVESTPTITGAMADHRVAVRASDVEAVARAIAGELGVAGASGGALPKGVDGRWAAAVARDLKATGAAALVVAGAHQPPAVHALAHAMNQSLGAVGTTVTYVEPVEASPTDQALSLRTLVDDMRAGRVETLVILGGNPVYSAPADLDFGGALQKVALRIHLGLYDDETGVQCQWHVPESHYLETWSDARAYDGTATVMQPLIQPLYESRSAHELVAALRGQGNRAGYDILREYWQTRMPGAGFEKQWERIVHDGVIPSTAARPLPVTLRPTAVGAPTPTVEGLEVMLRPDPCVWDGRYANNGWLQELPRPLTKLTWDNAAMISPRLAESQGISSGDRVELSVGGRSLIVPALILPGHPEDSVTLHLGQGRTQGGSLAKGTGVNAYALRTQASPWILSGAKLTKAGGRDSLATTQMHFSMEGRDLVRAGTLAEFATSKEVPEFARGEHDGELPTLYPDTWTSDRKDRHPKGPGDYEGQGYGGNPIPAWGMVIDNNACIGCNACVVACQSENNIATVGKDQVLKHREMHWLRIDTYYKGSADAPEAYFEPVTCMHCEKAPCEPVCPVEATSHSAEGINEQTYNRCVGTRYCSNNCPYKVRRFNFLQYSDQDTPSIQLMHNPDVTVRSRGVMEKCNYCVQRVNAARSDAEKADRPIADGDVVTACQQACPTEAIIFGNINDRASHGGKGSVVRRTKEEPLHYGILTELNTRPRTTYLAKLRNPNPELV